MNERSTFDVLPDTRVWVFVPIANGRKALGFGIVDPYAKWFPDTTLPLRVFDARGEILAERQGSRWLHPASGEEVEFESGW